MSYRYCKDKLFVKADKCEFHVNSVSFLGYIIESGQVMTDPQKIKAVVEWPKPTNRKQEIFGLSKLPLSLC